jgi:hypothetical protein
MSNPTFHRGVLVVNGVHFDTYPGEIEPAYADSTFTGCYPYTFWDCFSTPPSAGYPSQLPAPVGTGPVPADTLQQFSTVVWVGNNFNGDIPSWYDTPILSFIKAGGNVLLLSRLGQDFITEPLRDYLGITWTNGSSTTFTTCVSAYPGLVNMALTGTQNLCAVFDTTLSEPETELLFTGSVASQPRGLGAWRRPTAGGLHRADGAQFAFVSGRPYRYNRAALEANVEYILQNLFEEPKIPTAIGESVPRPAFALRQNYPNPFNPHTTIRFSLPAASAVTLRVYDVAGRHVRTLVSRDLKAGPYAFDWDGTDHRGEHAASGVYFYRLTAGADTATRKMVLVR